MSKVIVPRRWEPREYQKPLVRYLEGGGKRADVVAHRRWGKDDVALHWAAACAANTPGTYWHLLPEASQGRKAIWDAVNPHTGKRRIDEVFPKAMRERTRDAEMMIHLKKGSTWQVVGSDNFNSLMGSPPIGVVFSEWALAKPEAWSYIRPILAENSGCSTPQIDASAISGPSGNAAASGWPCPSVTPTAAHTRYTCAIAQYDQSFEGGMELTAPSGSALRDKLLKGVSGNRSSWMDEKIAGTSAISRTFSASQNPANATVSFAQVLK